MGERSEKESSSHGGQVSLRGETQSSHEEVTFLKVPHPRKTFTVGASGEWGSWATRSQGG